MYKRIFDMMRRIKGEVRPDTFMCRDEGDKYGYDAILAKIRRVKRRILSIYQKRTGTHMNVKNVAAIMPPMITAAIAFLSGTIAHNCGSVPIIIERDVNRIGLNLLFVASKMASLISIPSPIL